MQMLIRLACLGIEINHTTLRTGAAIGKLYFRSDFHGATEKILAIRDRRPVGEKSCTDLLGGVATQWFDLDPIKENWLFNLHRLVGIEAEIILSGRELASSGTADIEINVWSKYGRMQQLLNRKGLQTDGSHFAELNLQGVIRRSEVVSSKCKRLKLPSHVKSGPEIPEMHRSSIRTLVGGSSSIRTL